MRAQMEQLKVLRGQQRVLMEPRMVLKERQRVLRVVNMVVVEVGVEGVTVVVAVVVELQRSHYFGFLQMGSMAWDNYNLVVNAIHHR